MIHGHAELRMHLLPKPNVIGTKVKITPSSFRIQPAQLRNAPYDRNPALQDG